jgi:V/A-type H+-transporting ATPase subunit I
MKKISVVFLGRDGDDSLNELAGAGVVHLHECRGSSVDSESVMASVQTLEKAQIILGSLKAGKKEKPGRISGDPFELAAEVIRLDEEQKQLRDQHDRLLKDHSRFASFGDVSVNDLALIRDRGTDLRLYRLDKDTLKAVPDDREWISLGRSQGKTLAAFVADRDRPLPAEWEPLDVPESGETERTARLDTVNTRLMEIRQQLIDHVSVKTLIETELKKRQDLHLWESVKAGLGKEGELSYLNGFVPAGKLDQLKSLAARKGWGLLVDDPGEEDSVPTLLKTNAVTGLLKPVLDMLGILPGYREYDVSFFFLLFFSIFTAMLIGDAGYGFIFLGVSLLGIIITLGKKKKVPTALALLTVLSVVIIIWGAATGTWFSSKTLAANPFLSRLKLGFFSGTPEESNWVIMFISFFLGVFQLCLACLQGFVREFPQLKSFARLGWFGTLVVTYFFVLSQLLDVTFPPFLVYVLIAGVAMIFIFGSQEKGKNFFKGLMDGFLGNLLPNILNVIGTFSNVMSYIRLFAVGMAGVKIAEIFNGMAAPLATGPGIIAAVLILLVGHGLNIALGLLSVMVHAIRLNILEYSGQLGMEWSGFKYDPFSVKKTEMKTRGEST